MKERNSFLGWPMVGIAFLLYGLGLGPAYYSWGFLAPETIAELGLTRQEIGNTFGVFTLTFALTSPIAAFGITRIGLRPVILIGSLIAAAGFWQTSGASSAADFLVFYSMIGGVGVGLCTLLPAQTLPVHWFRRYRARATALIVLGAGVVGALVPATDHWVLMEHDWRFVWKIIAGISIGIGVLAAIVLRSHPSDVGQRRDGATADEESNGIHSDSSRSIRAPDLELDSRRAILSPQFFLVTFACLANTVPWRVVTAHGRLHLEDLGFAASLAAAILGIRVGASAVGRLTGSIGDFFDPRRVLALSLVGSAIGMTGFAMTPSVSTAYFWIALLGVAYGIGFTSEPVVLAHVFGIRSFVGSNGVRIAITGIVGWLAPRWTGAAADRADSYTTSFLVLAGVCLLGVVSILVSRSPNSNAGNEGAGEA